MPDEKGELYHDYFQDPDKTDDPKVIEWVNVAKAYKGIFSAPAGQIVLNDLKKAYDKISSHTPGDPYTTAFKEGQRDVVKRIEHMLELKTI